MASERKTAYADLLIEITGELRGKDVRAITAYLVNRDNLKNNDDSEIDGSCTELFNKMKAKGLLSYQKVDLLREVLVKHELMVCVAAVAKYEKKYMSPESEQQTAFTVLERFIGDELRGRDVKKLTDFLVKKGDITANDGNEIGDSFSKLFTILSSKNLISENNADLLIEILKKNGMTCVDEVEKYNTKYLSAAAQRTPKDPRLSKDLVDGDLMRIAKVYGGSPMYLGTTGLQLADVEVKNAIENQSSMIMERYEVLRLWKQKRQRGNGPGAKRSDLLNILTGDEDINGDELMKILTN